MPRMLEVYRPGRKGRVVRFRRTGRGPRTRGQYTAGRRPRTTSDGTDHTRRTGDGPEVPDAGGPDFVRKHHEHR